MVSIVELIDYIDNEIKRLLGSECITPVGQSSATGAITALKQMRSYIDKRTLLECQVYEDKQDA